MRQADETRRRFTAKKKNRQQGRSRISRGSPVTSSQADMFRFPIHLPARRFRVAQEHQASLPPRPLWQARPSLARPSVLPLVCARPWTVPTAVVGAGRGGRAAGTRSTRLSDVIVSEEQVPRALNRRNSRPATPQLHPLSVPPRRAHCRYRCRECER